MTHWNDNPTTPPTTGADPGVGWSGAPTATATATTVGPAPGGTPFPGADPAWSAGAPMPPPPPPRSPSSPSSPRGGGVRVAVVGLVVAALVGAGYAGRGIVDADDSTPAARTSAVASPTTATTANQPSTPLVTGSDDEPVADVAAALAPSIVVIKVGQGLGSGVIYDTSGLILTNAHVVENEQSVTVTLNDGSSLEGTVLGADTATDIAVVRVQPKGSLTAARLATGAPKLGELTVALGSPFGLQGTVTAGYVSAVNRAVENGSGGVVNMIQTDAAINPGNSGGALANRKGEVIGINSQIYSQSGDNAGIGFAIPIDKAKSVADRIVNGGSLDKAYLGVSTKDTTDGQAGARVDSVQSGSAAEQAGLKSGDVVVEIDGTAIKTKEELAGAIAAHNAGDTVTVKVRRGDQELSLTATLGKAPASAQSSNPSSRGRTPTNPNG